MVRLDKFLSDAGVGTRTELKAMIRQGRVTVDGEVVKKPEQKVTEQQTAQTVFRYGRWAGWC